MSQVVLPKDKLRPMGLTAREELLLHYLRENKNRIITKDELCDFLWPKNQGDVSDEALQRTISRFRKKVTFYILGGKLVTFPRQGYGLLDESQARKEQ